jgi:hypothetical protein
VTESEVKQAAVALAAGMLASGAALPLDRELVKALVIQAVALLREVESRHVTS